MNKKLEKHKKYLFLASIIVSLGITFTTVFKERIGSLGIVFIAIGGLLFIIGMRLKKATDETKIQ